MWHTWKADASFWDTLFEIDEQIAEDARKRGCGNCGGRLHGANYPRKVSGNIEGVHQHKWHFRFSFCCAVDHCRKRTTPPSVRFLGQKTYAAAVIVLACILRIVGGQADFLSIPHGTVTRWMGWWQSSFLSSRFWLIAKGAFATSPAPTRIPLSILEHFASTDPSAGLVSFLRWLAPITCRGP